ncbi:hypothetical protein MHYP_G00172300 [Metynnis hypsauchen]
MPVLQIPLQPRRISSLEDLRLLTDISDSSSAGFNTPLADDPLGRSSWDGGVDRNISSPERQNYPPVTSPTSIHMEWTAFLLSWTCLFILLLRVHC